ncbi:MAG: DegT/DnrJ/EryC1/StrS family aminotransferase [Acidobacteriaceae bacterium]|nr:DegT/DnrJ/EryC1/StrS family aminotransferase [Acidobacteriaceae bacterium]
MTSSRRASRGRDPVQVGRPKLPSTKALLQYLPRIDETRMYTNHGPLLAEFQVRVCELLDLPQGALVTAAPGTAAIIGAILATAGRARAERPLAFVPAFTYVATPFAVEQCGYQPYLLDVDASTWALDPQRLLAHKALDSAGVIVPVAPFGRPLPWKPWKLFQEKTGVPVVIDAAAAFDLIAEKPAQYVSEIPVAMSFHATKSLSTGEGGGVATTDLDLASRTTQALNFGFHETSEARAAGINGKMSEYHAAVGLAELDEWPEKRTALKRVAERYQKHAAEANIAEAILVAPHVSLSYTVFKARSASQSQAVGAALTQDGVEFRFWYRGGLHRQPYFSNVPHDDLSVTDRLAGELLGLPVAPDLDDATIARIISAVVRGVNEAAGA